MGRNLMDVIADCHRACTTCTGGTNSKDGRIACNLRNDKGEPAPIDCVIPRLAVAIESAGDPEPLIEVATTEYIIAHIKTTDLFPPAGASADAKAQAAKVAPLVAQIAAQSSGSTEAEKQTK